ncbi:alpha/beta fold hydrolase [Lentibacillus sp. N15]|uniref:alpha/beta fold hydrolase n=1 Tax=Lentibacillus songyuanensis TaxID=3136161 RepID=UPI0031BA9B34
MAWLTRNGLNIHYEWTTSENPNAEDTLILIHALGMDMNSWNFAIPYLRKNYHIMRYDIRGHGKTSAGEMKRTVDLFHEDLLFLIAKLNIHSYHIIAHGLGGFFGVQLAAGGDQELKSLIMMSVSLHYPKHLGNKVVDQRKEVTADRQNMLELGRRVMNNAFYPPTEEKVKVLLDSFEQVSPEVYFEIFDTDLLGIGVDLLRKITTPILLLSGAEDPMFPPELSNASLYLNSHARHYTVPQASFMIQMDQPEIMTEWIHSFIQKGKSNKTHDMLPVDYQHELTKEMYAEIDDILNEQEYTAPTLQVNVMNGFAVYINGQRIHDGWGQRKAKQLLVYLIFQQSTTREELCDIFWSEVDLESAKNRLRVSLHHLKKLLNADNDEADSSLLGTEREHVFLQTHVQSDLLLHMKAITDAHRIESSVEKVQAYKRLLKDVTDNPTPGLYEEWFLQLRDSIEGEWVEMARYLADMHEGQKEYGEAIYYIELALRYHVGAGELMGQLDRLKTS